MNQPATTLLPLSRARLGLVLAAVCAGLLLGCAPRAEWPPAPRDAKERLMVESAMRALRQQDGWTEVACVVEKSGPHWNVQAWKIVHPAARGRKKCVPWLVRKITLTDDGEVTAYRR